MAYVRSYPPRVKVIKRTSECLEVGSPGTNLSANAMREGVCACTSSELTQVLIQDDILCIGARSIITSGTLQGGTIYATEFFRFGESATPGYVLVADENGFGTWTDIGPLVGGEKVKVSALDTTADYLEPKLLAGTYVTITKNGPSPIYETLTFDVPLLQYLIPPNANPLAGNLVISGAPPTFYSGRLSAGNINYSPAQPAGSASTVIIINPVFALVHQNTGTSFNFADVGLLEFQRGGVVYSIVDSFDLGSAFVEGERAGVQSYPPATSLAGGVTILSAGWYNNFPDWQIGNARINSGAAFLQQGWNAIRMARTGMGAEPDQYSSPYEVFYDMGTIPPGINDFPTITERPGFVQTRALSGVLFYARGSQFYFSCVATNAFDNTYHSNGPITYLSSNNTMDSGEVDVGDPSVSGLSSPPVISETMTVTNKIVTVPSIAVPGGVRSMNSRISATARKPWATSVPKWSASENRMIDAYLQSSDGLNEYFDDEVYRLPEGAPYPGNFTVIPPAITGQWTSTALLVDGQAQVFNGSLIYPSVNFTSGYLPAPQTANYFGFSANQVYYRAIYKDGDPHSSGVLNFSPLVASDISPVGSGRVNVEIKLPGILGLGGTDWLDLGKPFDSGTFSGAYGDGCRVTVSGNSWTWTCGTFSTATSGWMIIVRVTILDSSISIDQIRETGW